MLLGTDIMSSSWKNKVDSTHEQPWWLALSRDKNSVEFWRSSFENWGVPSVTKEGAWDDRTRAIDLKTHWIRYEIGLETVLKTRVKMNPGLGRRGILRTLVNSCWYPIFCKPWTTESLPFSFGISGTSTEAGNEDFAIDGSRGKEARKDGNVNNLDLFQERLIKGSSQNPARSPDIACATDFHDNISDLSAKSSSFPTLRGSNCFQHLTKSRDGGTKILC